MLTCLTRAEPGSHLTGALCPRIAPSPMMTRCAVANFGNGFDEPLPSTWDVVCWGGRRHDQGPPAALSAATGGRGFLST